MGILDAPVLRADPQAWKPNTAWTAQSVVSLGTAIYRCPAAVAATAHFDPTKWDLLVADAGGITPARAFFAQDAAMRLVEESATLYRLLLSIGDGRWAEWDLRRSDTFSSAIPGSTTVHQLGRGGVVLPVLSVPVQDASVVQTGSWGTNISNANAYNSKYDSATGGTGLTKYKTWTTPAGVTAVGMRHLRFSNTGIWRVTVDGVAANLLPTAQQLVTAGVLASTALIANGGLLNPTDTVFDSYGANNDYDGHTLLADNLTAGVHTVRVDYTSYNNPASSASNVHISGFTYQTASTTIDTASTSLQSEAIVNGNNGTVTAANAWEYAYSVKPTGTSSFTFVGNAHGYETQTALTFAVDGAAVTPTVGSSTAATRKIVVTRTTTLFHPQLGSGATPIATVVTVYTLTNLGLRVAHATTWLVGGAAATSYPAMQPIDANLGFDTACVDKGRPCDLSTHRDSLYYGQAKGNMLTTWQRYGRCASGTLMMDAGSTVNNWEHSGTPAQATANRLCWQSSPSVSKQYFTRIGGNDPALQETFTAGTVWPSDTLRMFGRFKVGVAQVLGTQVTGSQTAPSVPAASTTYTNPFSFAATVYITGGTGVTVSINGVSTGLSSGTFRLPMDATINLGAYSVAPTWTWVAE